ncbi:MAG: energy transducer TonB [Firmicutes bacterium]|nr:energy transducer TonB [Bacillota bacterium]
MFARALIISLLLHLLLFALSEAGLFAICLRPPTVPPTEPSRRVINLVEPLSFAAAAEEENPVVTALPPGAKTVHQSVDDLKPECKPDPPLNERVKKEKEEKGPVSPVLTPAPASLPPTEDNEVVPEDNAVLPLLPAQLPIEAPPLLEPTPPISPPPTESVNTSPLPEGAMAEGEEQPERRDALVDEAGIRVGNVPGTILGQEEPGEFDLNPVIPTALGAVEQLEVGGVPDLASSALESTPSTGPVQLYHPAPVYPRQARRRGWEGTVCLEAVINREGQVVAVAITASSGYELLDQAACQAVEKWRYTWPAGETALPDEYLITIKISFQLEE